jgi:hypothetical protein
LLEDARLQLPQLGTGLDTHLVHQAAARRAIRLERLGLTTRAVQREHALRVQALPQWVLGGQTLEPSERLLIASSRKVVFDRQLRRRQPQLLEPADLRRGEGLRGDVGQRGAVPEGERLLRCVVRDVLVAAGLLDEALEAGRVHRVLAHAQLVAPPMGHDLRVVTREQAPKLRHVELHHLRRRSRRVLAP